MATIRPLSGVQSPKQWYFPLFPITFLCSWDVIRSSYRMEDLHCHVMRAGSGEWLGSRGELYWRNINTNSLQRWRPGCHLISTAHMPNVYPLQYPLPLSMQGYLPTAYNICSSYNEDNSERGKTGLRIQAMDFFVPYRVFFLHNGWAFPSMQLHY